MIKSQAVSNQQQESISILESQVNSLKKNLAEKSQTDGFYEEACSRQKEQITNLNQKLEDLENELKLERRRSTKFEDQVDQLREHLDKLTTSALHEKQSEISAAQSEKENLLKIHRLE